MSKKYLSVARWLIFFCVMVSDFLSGCSRRLRHERECGPFRSDRAHLLQGIFGPGFFFFSFSFHSITLFHSLLGMIRTTICWRNRLACTSSVATTCNAHRRSITNISLHSLETQPLILFLILSFFFFFFFHRQSGDWAVGFRAWGPRGPEKFARGSSQARRSLTGWERIEPFGKRWEREMDKW